MTLRTKQWLTVIGVAVLVVASIVFGQWRSHRAATAEAVDPAASVVSQPIQAAEDPGLVAEAPTAPQPELGEDPLMEDPPESIPDYTDIAPTTVCGQIGGLVLAYYFTASAGDPAWRDVLDSMLSPAGKAEQDSIGQHLIRPQEMMGYPATKEAEDPAALTLHCEGTSTLTGWMVALSRESLTSPWQVDSIRAMETLVGYFPPKAAESDLGST